MCKRSLNLPVCLLLLRSPACTLVASLSVRFLLMCLFCHFIGSHIPTYPMVYAGCKSVIHILLFTCLGHDHQDPYNPRDRRLWFKISSQKPGIYHTCKGDQVAHLVATTRLLNCLTLAMLNTRKQNQDPIYPDTRKHKQDPNYLVPSKDSAMFFSYM